MRSKIVTQVTKNIPNWKCPGLIRVHGHRLKKNLTLLHERIATQINGKISNTVESPDWMTGKTVLKQKDPGRNNAVDDYQPISYFPLMLNLMTGILSSCV